jgi:hypothetical protein
MKNTMLPVTMGLIVICYFFELGWVSREKGVEFVLCFVENEILWVYSIHPMAFFHLS